MSTKALRRALDLLAGAIGDDGGVVAAAEAEVRAIEEASPSEREQHEDKKLADMVRVAATGSVSSRVRIGDAEVYITPD